MSSVEAAQINGGFRKYYSPEFRSGDETMANETIEIVYEDFAKIV